MEKSQNLAKNLSMLCSLRRMTLAEFSKALDVPKSTLQYIYRNGNTTANTLNKISQKLHISADALMNEDLSETLLQPLMALLPLFEWFSTLNAQQQSAVSTHLLQILEVIKNETT